MLALRVTYLTGRVYASEFHDGDLKNSVEWPPHPSRLFSALVSAWGEGGAEPELVPVLEWIERRPPPTVYAGGNSPRKLVQAYVPVNDIRSLPEDRPRKGRQFPSASLLHPNVYFVWADDLPAHLHEPLDRILNRTCALGHSASLVSVEVTDSLPVQGLRVWQPGEHDDPVRLRVPSPGRFADLEVRYRRFQANPSKVNRPSAGRSVLYGRPRGTTASSEFDQGVFGETIVFRLDGPRVGLPATLHLTAALRGAMLGLADQPVPEYISGHASTGAQDRPAPSERPHIAFVPLAFCGSDHATGDLLGLATLLPRALSSDERAVCWETASRIEELRVKWGAYRVELSDFDEPRVNLREGAWTRPSAIWSTVTPFVFDRYPKNPFGKEAEQVVREAIARVGLPPPVVLDLHYNAWHSGVPRASGFWAAAPRPGKPQRYHCHVRVEFERPVRGPLVAGAGRFYGYGLFRPHREGMNQ